VDEVHEVVVEACVATRRSCRRSRSSDAVRLARAVSGHEVVRLRAAEPLAQLRDR